MWSFLGRGVHSTYTHTHTYTHTTQGLFCDIQAPEEAGDGRSSGGGICARNRTHSDKCEAPAFEELHFLYAPVLCVCVCVCLCVCTRIDKYLLYAPVLCVCVCVCVRVYMHRYIPPVRPRNVCVHVRESVCVHA